jgi:hypothetical protein
MTQFMIAYHGGDKPKSKEEGMAQMGKWKTWIDSLGDAVINPGTPLPASKLVTSGGVLDDSDPNAMNGFAVIQADSMEAAIEIAKSDPFLEMNGQIRISEMMDMK